MTLFKGFQSVLRGAGALRNARYVQIRALHQANSCELHSLHSTPEEFLLKCGSDLTPQLVSSYVTEQGDPELAYRLFSSARQHDGYTHTSAAYSAIIHALCRAKDFDLLEKLLKDMKQESCSVRDTTFGFMLKAMSEQGMVREASSLFNRIADFDCKPTSVAYKAVISSFISAGKMEEAMRVFAEMRDANVYPDSLLVGMLTHGLCKAKKVNEALKMIESVAEIPGSVDMLTVNGIVGCVCKAGRPSDACRFLENMKGFGVTPNTRTFNVLMVGFCLVGEVDEALRLLEKMSEDSVKPDKVTLSTLLSGLSKQVRIDEALALFERMDSKVGWAANSFNIMVNVLCRNKRFSEACMLVSEMHRRDLHPTAHTYTAIVNGLFRLGKVEGACQILVDMKKVGIIADSRFYNELIIGLCKAARMDDARSMLAQMAEKGWHPSKHTHCAMIHGLCKANRISEAMQLGKDMIKSSCDKDIICWNPLLETLCRLGMVEEALKFLDVLSEHGWVPVRSTYSCMLKGLGLAKKLDEVRKLLVDMKKNGIEADMVTYAALIDTNMHCRPGMVDLFRPIIGGNVVLQLGRYTNLIDGLFEAGEAEFALKVFEEMQRVGCAPDTLIFTTLINGLCKNKQLHEAEKFFQKMRGYGCAPDTFTYTVLMNGLCNAGDYDAADLVYKEMRAEGICQPDNVMYGILLNAFSRGGKFKEMYEVLDDMKVQGCPPNDITLRSLFWTLSHKDVKRVNKHIKEAFGISFAPEISEEGVSTTQMSLVKVQDEENAQLHPGIKNAVMDTGKENTRRVRVPGSKESFKVVKEKSKQALASIKEERQKGVSKRSSMDKSQEGMSSPHRSVRTSSSKVPKEGKTQIRQLHAYEESVEARKQDGTRCSHSSARMGSLKHSGGGELRRAWKVERKTVSDVSEEYAKRPRSSSRTRVFKENECSDMSQEDTRRPRSSRSKVSKEERVHRDLKGMSSAKASSHKIPRKAQISETWKVKQKQKV